MGRVRLSMYLEKDVFKTWMTMQEGHWRPMKGLQALVAEIVEMTTVIWVSPVSALWKSDREKPLLKMSYDISAVVCQKAWGRLWSQMEEEPLVGWDQNWAFGHQTKCHVWCSPIAVHHQKCTILTVKHGDVLRQILEGLWAVADEINAAKHG